MTCDEQKIALGNFLFNLRLLMLETCLAIIVNVNVNQNLIFAQLISKQQNHVGFTQNDLTEKISSRLLMY